jgi:hypothetical protein
MKYNSIQPFVPSGSDFQASKALFLELGFTIISESNGYIRFENNGAGFILQDFDDKNFAENFMMRVAVGDLDEFWQKVSEQDLPAKFGVKLKEPTRFPWGREVNMIDIAGVCWHFTEGAD